MTVFVTAKSKLINVNAIEITSDESCWHGVHVKLYICITVPAVCGNKDMLLYQC